MYKPSPREDLPAMNASSSPLPFDLITHCRRDFLKKKKEKKRKKAREKNKICFYNLFSYYSMRKLSCLSVLWLYKVGGKHILYL